MSTPDTQFTIDKLSRYQARNFVPDTADLKCKEVVVPLYEKLLQREVYSAEELEKWVLERSELEAALDQERDILYIKMTCQTDNTVYAEEYKKFIEIIHPAVMPLADYLNKKYLTLLERFSLDPQRYKVYDCTIRADIELYREENVDLETQIQLLSQEYQTISGAMTVTFQGEERTLPQMSKFLQEPNRSIRESAWRAITERRNQDRDRLDELFDKMLKIRHQIAVNADFSNFAEYQFRAYHRFDYTSRECKQYHEAIESLVVPVWKKILQKRQQQMKLESLRPWDIQVDPLGRAPLAPFSSTPDFISGIKEIFSRINDDFGTQFSGMADNGLLDLDSRKGKAPGGYQNTLPEARSPFIFMNAVGVDDDVRTLLHEGGHAFHALACAHDPIYDYRHAPLEFCEVASMSMELLGEEHLDVFYTPEEIERSRQIHLEGIVQVLVWVANIDAFQHWIYENPGHTREQRTQIWRDIYNRFGGNFIDWQGLDEYQASLWHRQLHIFEVPFYYIEYGIAQLGALQIWLNARKDLESTIALYKAALALGGARPLPELFETAGLKFDFSEETIAPLVEAVYQELNLLD